MATWIWVVIVVAIVVVVVAALARAASRDRRSGRLRGRFGPEYDRTVARSGDQTVAEKDLIERERRRDAIELKPLAPAARQSFIEAWRADQATFVDDPSRAIVDADRLIQTVMRERGYPVEQFEDRAAIVSVDHPLVVERYRRAHQVSVVNADGRASTETLRQAMQDYRALFMDLVESDASVENDGATAVSEQPAARIEADAPPR